jgi:translation initiation factor IF-1
MPKEEMIQVKATVVEPVSLRVFRVVLDNQLQVLARIDRKAFKHFARILPGDCVVVEMVPSDLHRGRIISRC